jgi:hypothetical protein
MGDIRSEAATHTRGLGEACIQDFLSASYLIQYPVLITNPPFSLAMEFLRKGLEIAEIVVLLLRSNFLGSQERAPFFREHMPDRYQLPNRPTFVHVEKWDPKKQKWTRTSGDSTEYEWMVFRRAPRSVGTSQVLAITPEADVAAARKLAPVIRVGAGPDEATPVGTRLATATRNDPHPDAHPEGSRS